MLMQAMRKRKDAETDAPTIPPTEPTPGCQPWCGRRGGTAHDQVCHRCPRCRQSRLVMKYNVVATRSPDGDGYVHDDDDSRVSKREPQAWTFSSLRHNQAGIHSPQVIGSCPRLTSCLVALSIAEMWSASRPVVQPFPSRPASEPASSPCRSPIVCRQ